MRILTAKELSFVKPAPSKKYPELKEVVVAFIADIQYFKIPREDGEGKIVSPTVDLDKLQMTVKRLAGMPNAMWILGGDAIDVASPSNRKAYDSIHSALYDSFVSMTTAGVLELIDDVVDILKPIRGRGAILSGHHLWWFKQDAPEGVRGKNSDQVLAERLDVPYLGEGLAILHVPLGGKREAIVLAVHPDGYGTTLTAPLNKLIRDVIPYHEFDVAAIAHYQRKLHASTPAIGYPVEGGTTEVSRKIVSMGGYMKSYVEGVTTYAERKMYPPLALGSPFVFLRPLPSGRIDLEVEE